ncbi:hypothetical protein [Hyalangium sp.]|uniref:hypothetical protein n=1 Tax=Hyalangium sp. TaxID=2028555 RepID=UPI002D46E378|nr:hypothetical protein [Hyalangium sp.]HYI00532.1 hypothetical protein [Hyalangium sp.]
MNRLSSALVVLSLFLAGAAHAQDWRNRSERTQDRREVHQDKREMRDDRWDMAQLQALLTRFDQAWAQRSERGMAAVEAQLGELLRAELAEGRAELARDKAEVRRDNREVQGSRRELGRDELWGRPGAYADDRRDLKDDRRDRRDDVRDARAEAASLRTKVAIARELSTLMGSRRPGDLQRMRSIIVELMQLGQKELRENQKELKEDRREQHEDRRERREAPRRHF